MCELDPEFEFHVEEFEKASKVDGVCCLCSWFPLCVLGKEVESSFRRNSGDSGDKSSQKLRQALDVLWTTALEFKACKVILKVHDAIGLRLIRLRSLVRFQDGPPDHY